MPARARPLFLTLALLLAACGDDRGRVDPRGVDRDETLLSVNATGQAEAVPDMAYLELGVNATAPTAKAAADANARRIAQVVEAMSTLGVKARDTQTSNLSIRKIEWGPDKGKYQASNVLQVRMREIDRASEVVAAATQAGMNVLSGPSLRISDPEAAAKGAYAAAYKAARTRADAYAGAAGLKVARVLTIRDGGAMPLAGPVAMDAAAEQVAAPAARTIAPPPVAAPAPVIRAGSTITTVAVQVDFALTAK